MLPLDRPMRKRPSCGRKNPRMITSSSSGSWTTESRHLSYDPCLYLIRYLIAFLVLQSTTGQVVQSFSASILTIFTSLTCDDARVEDFRFFINNLEPDSKTYSQLTIAGEIPGTLNLSHTCTDPVKIHQMMSHLHNNVPGDLYVTCDGIYWAVEQMCGSNNCRPYDQGANSIRASSSPLLLPVCHCATASDPQVSIRFEYESEIRGANWGGTLLELFLLHEAL